MPALPGPPARFTKLFRDPGAAQAVWEYVLALQGMSQVFVTPSAQAKPSAGKACITGTPPNLFLQIALMFPQGYAAPTGTPKRTTFNADLAFPVSNPPTQAEVQAIAAALIASRQVIAALVLDAQATGMIVKNA